MASQACRRLRNLSCARCLPLALALFVTVTRAVRLLDVTCAHESGLGSHAHEDTLNKLNERSVVFIGDSVSRYQYLELAYYVVHGVCPSRDAHPGKYILSELGWPDWDTYFRETSEQVTRATSKSISVERCFCRRAELSPGRAQELRTFRYNDFQVSPRDHNETNCK